MPNVHPRLGGVKDPVDTRDFALKAVLRAPVPLPTVIDQRKYLSPIKNQQQRGACVSFATAKVKEWQERKQRGTKLPIYDFSEEFIYDQIRLPGGGAYFRDGMKVLVNSGVPREKYMPYDPNISDDAPREFKPSSTAIRNAAYYKAAGYARLHGVDDMLQSLFLNGPFVLGVDWGNGWFNVKEHTDEGFPLLTSLNWHSSAGGHALCIPYADQDRKLFLFPNSWGESWGKDGWAAITFEALDKYIQDAWASLDLTSKAIDVPKLKEMQVQV